MCSSPRHPEAFALPGQRLRWEKTALGGYASFLSGMERWASELGLEPADPLLWSRVSSRNVPSKTQSQERQVLVTPQYLGFPRVHPTGHIWKLWAGRQHHGGWLLGPAPVLARPRSTRGRGGRPVAVAWLWRIVQSKAKAPQGTRGASKGCLLGGACLFPDTCFSHIRCPPTDLAPLEKPLECLAAESCFPTTSGPQCSAAPL